MTNIDVEFIIALVMILLYAWSRYATPSTVRFDTTWGKFLLGRLAYCCICLGVFITLFASPPFLQVIIELSGMSATLGTFQEDFSVPLLAALILTIFLSEIPILSKWDHALRTYFHRVAAIPRERRRWIALLQGAGQDLDDESQSSLVRRFEAQGLKRRDIVLHPDDSPRYLWTRISTLIDRLEALSAQGQNKYSCCLTSPEYKNLVEKYKRARPKAKALFELDPVDPSDRLVKMLNKEFTEQCESILGYLYEFISGMILKCELTEKLRLKCLRSLGLVSQHHQEAAAVGLHEMLWLLVLILVFLFSTLSHLGAPLVLLIAFNYIAAVLIAVGFNELRHQFKPDEGRQRLLPPIGRYLLAGSFSFFVTSCATVMYLYATGQSSDLQGSIATFLNHYWPWSLISFTLSVVVAFLVGDWLAAKVPGNGHRRFDLFGVFNPVEGLFLSLCLALCSNFVVLPLLMRFGTPGELPADTAFALRTAAIGFLIGGFAPAVYRNAARREKERAQKLPEITESPDTGRWGRCGHAA